MPDDQTNGKILQMISMIDQRQQNMDKKIDNIGNKVSHTDTVVAALPCVHMDKRLKKVEDDTEKNTRMRWSLKTFAIFFTSPIVVAIIVSILL